MKAGRAFVPTPAQWTGPLISGLGHGAMRLGKDDRGVYFLRSRLGTSGGDTARGAAGDVGATAVRTCFGFFASLLPRWPLDMIVPSLSDA